jgi:hypothetical protein
MAKEKETKKEEKEESKSTNNLQQKMDDITFKNDQIKMVRDLQSENAKLKQMMGNRGGKRRAEAPRIQGLQSIKNTLGRQFQKRGTDY